MSGDGNDFVSPRSAEAARVSAFILAINAVDGFKAADTMAGHVRIRAVAATDQRTMLVSHLRISRINLAPESYASLVLREHFGHAPPK